MKSNHLLAVDKTLRFCYNKFMKNDNPLLSKVQFSLEAGCTQSIMSNRAVVGLSIFCGFGLLMMPVSIILAVFVDLVLLALLFVTFIALIFILLIVRNQKIKKRIKPWLEDAVILKARCTSKDEQWDIMQTGYIPIPYHKARLQIAFNYNGNKYKKSSNDFSPHYSKYAGQEIDILYSHKYKQVLILKQKLPLPITSKKISNDACLRVRSGYRNH